MLHLEQIQILNATTERSVNVVDVILRSVWRNEEFGELIAFKLL